MNNWFEKHNITKDIFINACMESTTMAEACSKLKLHFNTFKRKAIELGCYETNQGGKGNLKNRSAVIPLSDILDGKYPAFQTYKLKWRLLHEKVFTNTCSTCEITEWNGVQLIMELDHIDGDRTNHKLSNLRMLCPNCHAQTDTYRGRNIHGRI